MLKVILQQENPNLYFASIQGIEWVYAQGSTRAECLEYLESVLREVLTLKIGYLRNCHPDTKKLEMTF